MGVVMSEKLTFGEDHSEGALVAWDWITSQSWPHWNLEIISVEQSHKRTESSPLGYDTLHEWNPENPRKLPEDCGFDQVRYLTAHHDPRIILSSCTDSTLLVVGARGKGLMKALHIGSTVESLLQCPNTPLLIARQSARIQRILVCVDGSSHADAAVDLLTRFPWISNTDITVLAVVEYENMIRDRAQAAAQQLEATGANVEVQFVLPDPFLITTNPRIPIMEVSEQIQAQIIVMGTKGLTGLPRMKVGSVASAIAHHSKSSVLLVCDQSEDEGTD
jgi:nucleotide-binding universal stress UspA family protein